MSIPAQQLTKTKDKSKRLRLMLRLRLRIKDKRPPPSLKLRWTKKVTRLKARTNPRRKVHNREQPRRA